MTRRALLSTMPMTGLAAGISCRKGAARDFALPDSSGATVRLSDYLGKVILLDFWATWCGGCKVEIPWFMEFAETYKNRGFAVVGVSLDEDGWKTVRPFLAEWKINYPVVVASEWLASEYEVTALPTTLLIDREGKIVRFHGGMVEKDVIRSEIEALL